MPEEPSWTGDHAKNSRLNTMSKPNLQYSQQATQEVKAQEHMSKVRISSTLKVMLC